MRIPIGLFAALFLGSFAAHAAQLEAISPARLLPMGEAYAGSSINVVANRRHALFTHRQEQFAAFYDAHGRLVLAHRQLDSDEWRTQRTPYTGNTADAHNSISLAVDGEGVLHVAWDHHGGELNYARSVRPLALELGEKRSMLARQENRVTYPEFYRLPDGDLLCMYRDGASGDGSVILNRYLVREQKWRRVQDNLLDGQGQRSAYWGATVDRSGRLHLTWIWRDTPDVASNHDLAYAYSPDAGSTWFTADEQAAVTPFKEDSSPYAARIARGRNLMNSPWVTADARSRPYIVTYWSAAEGSAPQFHVVHRDGASWRIEPITRRTEAFELAGIGTRRPPISRGVFLVEGDREHPAAHLVYRDDALGGAATLVSTPALGSGEWHARALTRTDMGAWEPTIDPVQWAYASELHLLVQRVEQLDGDDLRAPAAVGTPIASLILSTHAFRTPTLH